jgi:hypothetical protein
MLQERSPFAEMSSSSKEGASGWAAAALGTAPAAAAPPDPAAGPDQAPAFIAEVGHAQIKRAISNAKGRWSCSELRPALESRRSEPQARLSRTAQKQQAAALAAQMLQRLKLEAPDTSDKPYYRVSTSMEAVEHRLLHKVVSLDSIFAARVGPHGAGWF